MLHHGRVVLYDAVQTIRRTWAAHAVVVQGSGNFANLPGVERAEAVDGAVELWLDDHTTPQAVLHELATRPDLAIERFEIATPSLDDIFIAVVEGQQRVVWRAVPQPSDLQKVA